MKDPEHLSLLRSLGCAVLTHRRVLDEVHLPGGVVTRDWSSSAPIRCSLNVEAHHRTGAGLALKASDYEAFPLCTAHHRQFHDASGVFRGWTREQRNDWQDRMVKLYAPEEDIF